MRGTTIKKINKKADRLLLEWLSSLVSEKEAEGITINNLKNFLPKDKYFVAQKTLRLSFAANIQLRQSQLELEELLFLYDTIKEAISSYEREIH